MLQPGSPICHVAHIIECRNEAQPPLSKRILNDDRCQHQCENSADKQFARPAPSLQIDAFFIIEDSGRAPPRAQHLLKSGILLTRDFTHRHRTPPELSRCNLPKYKVCGWKIIGRRWITRLLPSRAACSWSSVSFAPFSV